MFGMKSIEPFSNALSYMAWEERNCCRCAKSSYANYPPEYCETDCDIQSALWDGTRRTIPACIAKRANLPDGEVCGEFEPMVEEADHESQT